MISHGENNSRKTVTMRGINGEKKRKFEIASG
jgi:hypothetical protein